jgi:hypothetical protein
MLLAKMSASLNFQWRGYCFIAYATSKYVGEVNPELLNKPKNKRMRIYKFRITDEAYMRALWKV